MVFISPALPLPPSAEEPLNPPLAFQASPPARVPALLRLGTYLSVGTQVAGRAGQGPDRRYRPGPVPVPPHAAVTLRDVKGGPRGRLRGLLSPDSGMLGSSGSVLALWVATLPCLSALCLSVLSPR